MELKELQEKIKELLSKDVSAKIEKVKGGGDKEYNYLSWAWCFTEVMKIDAHFSYKVLENADGMPYWFDEDLGYIVKTEMTILGITRTMWLPVMDSRNYSMKNTPYEVKTKYNTYKVEKASMFDVNRAIMRCLVKNVAMCIGLGLYIYAGEDLPEAIETEKDKTTENKPLKVEVKEIKAEEKKTPKKAQKTSDNGFIETSELPFEKFMGKFVEVHKEEKDIEMLENLKEMINDRLLQIVGDNGERLRNAYQYYATNYGKNNFDELEEKDLRNIITDLDKKLEKRA